MDIVLKEHWALWSCFADVAHAGTKKNKTPVVGSGSHAGQGVFDNKRWMKSTRVILWCMRPPTPHARTTFVLHTLSSEPGGI